ncbi:MAG: DUF262 domain-containing protein [archaeon]|jgi:hypothetical protein
MSKLEKFTKEYSITGLVNQLKNGQINTDAEMQRSYVWGQKEQTEFIDSVFQSDKVYIPPVIGAETEQEIEIRNKMEKIIDLLDGLQRCTTLEKLLNNEIRIGNNIKPVTIEQEDGTEKTYIVSGLTWEEIPEELKTFFKSNKIQMVFFKGMTYEERERQFIKLNGGKKLTNAELNKAKIGQDIREFIYRQLTADLWTKYVKVSNNRETKFETMQQTIMLLSGEYCFKGKNLAEFAENATVTEETLSQIEILTEYLNNVAKNIKKAMLPTELQKLEESEVIEKLDEKQLKKWVKPIEYLKKVNVPIIYVVAQKAIKNNINENQFAEFLTNFFENEPFEYNRYTGSGSADSKNVKGRINSMTEEFVKYFEIEEQQETEQEDQEIETSKQDIINMENEQEQEDSQDQEEQTIYDNEFDQETEEGLSRINDIISGVAV